VNTDDLLTISNRRRREIEDQRRKIDRLTSDLEIVSVDRDHQVEEVVRLQGQAEWLRAALQLVDDVACIASPDELRDIAQAALNRTS